MSQIAAFPTGLQGLLDLKGQGLPSVLQGFVVPIIDLTQLYLASKQETVVFTPSANVVGGTNLFGGTSATVPPGELWYVWAAMTIIQPGAGASGRVCLQASFGGTNIPLGQTRTALALEQVRANMDNIGIIMTSGSYFSAGIDAFVGVYTATGAAIISRLRV
jgi:hypothetical protein